ncbi:hypothetical protein Q5M47_13585, partial [Acinetobacter nosocomialis]
TDQLFHLKKSGFRRYRTIFIALYPHEKGGVGITTSLNSVIFFWGSIICLHILAIPKGNCLINKNCFPKQLIPNGSQTSVHKSRTLKNSLQA